MKKLIFTLIAFIVCISIVQAQSTTQSFNADGIKVIFKPTTKNVINVRVYFRGGVTNYTANKAGIEELALDATTKCGTKIHTPTAFRDTADKYGILMYGASTYDYGYVQVNCISKYFDKGWDLFSEAIMNPVFDNDEVNLLKNKIISANKTRASGPDYRLSQLQMQAALGNTPYAINPDGDEQTLGALSAADVAAYYKTLLNKNRMFIVVVGNITKQELFEKILLAFDEIPSKAYTPVDLKTPVFNDNKLNAEKRDLKINYIGAIMNAPEFTDVNYVPFRIGISGLSGNLYSALHSQYNLAYSINTNVMELKMPFAWVRISSIHAQETMDGILKALKQTQASGLTDEWLQHIKNVYLTQSFINDQSASGITNSLGSAEILGNWQYADDLTELVNMVTVEQVNNALNFYIGGLRWSYLGNEEADGFKPPIY